MGVLKSVNIPTVLATVAVIAVGNKFSYEFKKILEGRF